MARSQFRSQRKPSGGRFHASRSKRNSELAGYVSMTKVSTQKRMQKKRVVGANYKYSLLQVKEINVTDKSGKTAKTPILNVVNNTANQNLVRRNVITKGAVVETKLGRVRVTSRPGQEASVNGRLV
ncbi:30S ribosomal protein S8e [Candidatus Woesearchaeota archaeon]|nr:30S ribosomal protein S8e [Candidatus Woesearchaeota archaeon]